MKDVKYLMCVTCEDVLMVDAINSRDNSRSIFDFLEKHVHVTRKDGHLLAYVDERFI